MNDLQRLLFMALGVLISLLLPVLTSLVRQFLQPSAEPHSVRSKWRKFWRHTRKYVYIGVFSFVTAALLLAIYRSVVTPDQVQQIDNWAKALLFGYTYDSTIQKLTIGMGSQSPEQGATLPHANP